jgi:hypothetical protein
MAHSSTQLAARIVLRHYLAALQSPHHIALAYDGFEVTFSTASIVWVNVPSSNAEYTAVNEDRRVFDITPAPANVALHPYINDLAFCTCRFHCAARGPGGPNVPVMMLGMRVEEEQWAVMSWIRTVCEAERGLSIEVSRTPSFIRSS